MSTVETIYFHADGYQLVGTLHLPDTPNPPVIIGCHGLLANRHSQKQIALASACNQEGIAYFRFDHRGCGDSQGDFTRDTSLAARSKDLYHAIQTMQHHSAVGSVTGLFGSSFGGTVVLDHASRHPSPALITYAAPINSASIHLTNIRDNNGHSPPAEMFTDAMVFDIEGRLESISKIFICHSQGDETVPASHANKIFHYANSPKQIHIFKAGDHPMSPSGHQKKFKALFIQWILRHIKAHS